MALLKYICFFLSFHQKCLFDLVSFEQLLRPKHSVTHTHTPKPLYKVVYPYKFFQAQLNFDISPGISIEIYLSDASNSKSFTNVVGCFEIHGNGNGGVRFILGTGQWTMVISCGKWKLRLRQKRGEKERCTAELSMCKISFGRCEQFLPHKYQNIW